MQEEEQNFSSLRRSLLYRMQLVVTNRKYSKCMHKIDAYTQNTKLRILFRYFRVCAEVALDTKRQVQPAVTRPESRGKQDKGRTTREKRDREGGGSDRGRDIEGERKNVKGCRLPAEKMHA